MTEIRIVCEGTRKAPHRPRPLMSFVRTDEGRWVQRGSEADPDGLQVASVPILELDAFLALPRQAETRQRIHNVRTGVRSRHQFPTCSACGASPQYRQEVLDAALNGFVRAKPGEPITLSELAVITRHLLAPKGQ